MFDVQYLWFAEVEQQVRTTNLSGNALIICVSVHFRFWVPRSVNRPVFHLARPGIDLDAAVMTKHVCPSLETAAPKTRLLLIIPSLQAMRLSCPSRKATNLAEAFEWHWCNHGRGCDEDANTHRVQVRKLCAPYKLGNYVHQLCAPSVLFASNGFCFQVRHHPIVDRCQQE